MNKLITADVYVYVCGYGGEKWLRGADISTQGP